jgi:hypothetical protein
MSKAVGDTLPPALGVAISPVPVTGSVLPGQGLQAL